MKAQDGAVAGQSPFLSRLLRGSRPHSYPQTDPVDNYSGSASFSSCLPALRTAEEALQGGGDIFKAFLYIFAPDDVTRA